MFESKRFARIRQMFAEQFEPDEKGFLYRQRSKGAPIPVSAEERAAFIATFNNHLRYTSWAALIAGLAVALAHLWYADGTPQADVLFYTGYVALPALFVIGFYRVWNAPLRALRERTPIGEPRTEGQMRHIRLSRVSYTQLFLGMAIAAIIPFRIEGDWLAGWNPVYLSIAAIVVPFLLIIALMKWRAASDHAADAAGPVWKR